MGKKVLSGGERGVWCWVVERDKEGLGSSYSKEAWVMDIWDSLTEKGRGRWNPCFFKPFNDYEVEVVKSFLVRLHGKRVCGDVEDTVLWTETKSGKFLVKSLYNALDFFAWKATWDKALTLNLVQKRSCGSCSFLWSRCHGCFVHRSERLFLVDNGSFVGKKRKKVWRTVPLHIFWTV
ncbi:hypothetical protein AAG906_009850 [Vitis piasezkii]